ncbi:MAG: carboxylesterase family protein, partial [Pseudomonadales bacterium]
SRLSDGLFQRAVLQSSTCGPIVLQPLTERYTQGEFFKKTWGCEGSATPLDCTRTQSAIDLRQKLDDAGKSGDLLGGDLIGQEVFRPAAAIDNYVFAAAPHEAIADSPNDVDVIVGVNLNEFTLFQVAEGNDNPDNTLASYQQLVRDTLAGVSETDVVELTTNLYPCSNYATCSDAFSDLFGDAIFACPSIATADALIANGNTVRFYEFTQPIDGGLLLGATVPVLDNNAPQLGVPHSAELFYLWNLPVLQAGSDPVATVTAMQQYWGSFAGTGEPVSAGNPAWPLYTDNGGEHLEIGENITARSGFKIEKCNFINERQLGSG